MSKKNNNLSIRYVDFEFILKNDLLKDLRKLTLHPRSGMNKELDRLYQISKNRNPNAKVILGFFNEELVTWALLSKEPSDYGFRNHYDGFKPEFGTLFEIFVNPSYRRLGFGKKIVQIARRKLNNTTICFCPWDETSEKFFNNFKNYNHIKM